MILHKMRSWLLFGEPQEDTGLVVLGVEEVSFELSFKSL